MATSDVRVASEDCKRCANIEGAPIPGVHRVTLKNEDKIYRCPACGAMWGVAKDGERIDGGIS